MKINQIICFPSIPWEHSWERQQELMLRLAEHFSDNEVFIHNPLGLINHTLIDIYKKVKDRYSKTGSDILYINKRLDNMKFIDFLFMPIHFNTVCDYINFKLLNRATPLGGSDLVWATYVNGFTLQYFSKAKYKILDFATRRQVNEEISEDAKLVEKEAVKVADLIFVDNYNTFLDYKAYNSNIFYAPQGVNLEAFRSRELAEEYLYLKKEDKKIIGYCGNLHKYIDYPLLEKVIRELPEYIFLFVGDILDDNANALKKFPNVIFSGFKLHDTLYKYYNLFDVGIIPYTLEPYTTGVYPTKFLEYVACQVPVISSRLPDLEQYNLDFLKIYNDEHEFVKCIKHSLSTEVNVEEMRDFSKDNTWDSRFNLIESKINGLIA